MLDKTEIAELAKSWPLTDLRWLSQEFHFHLNGFWMGKVHFSQQNLKNISMWEYVPFPCSHPT